MKKVSALFCTTALFIFITSCSPKMSAQSDPVLQQHGIQKAAVIVPVEKIPSRIFRSYISTYGEQPGAWWFKSANGFGVNFINRRISFSVYYLLNGVTDCSILHYSEDRMPQSVRHFVKSRFYDYSISHVTEVNKNETVAYYVKIEDSTVIKTIKIVDGEWEMVEELHKK